MVELDLVNEGKITYTGIFDFKEFYSFLYDWFDSYHYLVIERGYKEKLRPEGKEIEAEWICLRRISDYFRFRIKAVIRTFRMVGVEVVREGIKVQRDKGDIEIKLQAWLERDYENKWEANPVIKFLRGIYDKYIIKSRIEHYETTLGAELDEIISQAKSFLALAGKR